ncbi:MAG TPA: SDR family NAD(P)-dependent oxidoreductase [Steroidobacteraceae bacterium]|nr:SDR family NAD(P)-dependent oxidoreductase [Steroidobacteraceae bacterium]
MKGTALVIGAAGGMGTQVAKLLHTSGYNVAATVLDEKEEAHLKAAVPGLAAPVKLDLANADTVLAGLKKLALPSLDAVVVCAAIGPTGPLETQPLALFRRTLEINTVAAVAIYQACMPALRAAKGRLVFISSFAGKVGLPFIGFYVASKHALEGLGDVMRREAKMFGVDIVLVEPGGVKTGMVEGQLAGVARDRAALQGEEAERYGPMYDGFLKLVKRSWDVMIEPAVVAETVLTALRANPPQARYQVGDDSKFLVEASRKPDTEIDAIVANFGAV